MNVLTNVVSQRTSNQSTNLLSRNLSGIKTSELKSDTISISKPIKKQNKVCFKECVKLFANGFNSQLRSILEQGLKHPIKTIAIGGVTTFALMLLPLIGVPTAVGASVLGLSAFAFGTGSIISNSIKAIKHNKEEKYDEVRNDIKEIGKSSMNVAMSLPFVPKAFKTTKDFIKYGKFSFNSAAASSLITKKGLRAKYGVLKDANKEFARSYDYQKIVDRKLSTENLTRTEKAQIRQELLDFNVPEDKISEVVAEKLMKYKGYNARPTITRTQRPAGALGSFNSSRCNIDLKDYSKPDLPESPICRDENPLISINQRSDGDYTFVMQDRQTGHLFEEIVPKQMWEDRVAYERMKESVSPKGKEILTLVHEFEHFDQHVKTARLDGVKPRATEQAKRIYASIIKEKGLIPEGSPLELEAIRYEMGQSNYISSSRNYAKYFKNPVEVDARAIQHKAIKTQEFQRLDSVLKEIKPDYSVDMFDDIVIGNLYSNSIDE